jgi:steroid 5-alpha-reductase/3-oxo-5-alpha-steroid 4-dehydrogenase 1
MSEASVHGALVGLILLLAPLTFLSLLLVPAPYGRHARPGWGPLMDTRLAWVVMEAPSVLAYLFFHFRGPRALDPVPVVFLCLWQAHYLHRAFVYPLASRARGGETPVAIVAMGFAFNVINSYINATWITRLGPAYPSAWLASPPFLLGAFLFAAGFWINREADRRLRALRPPEGGYGIPRGWLFEQVSCPNYLGEILEWCGWALLTWSPAGLAFAVYTIANLAPRALAHHRWYRSRFPDYPQGRKALVPLVLLIAGLAFIPAPARAADAAAARALGDALFARRAERARGNVADPALVDQAIAAYRAAVAQDPADMESLGRLLYALHFRGAYCGANAEAKKAIFEEGRRLGQSAVDRLEKQAGGRPDPERLAALRAVPGAVSVYYWTTAHLGEWALVKGKLAAARAGVAGKVRDLAQTVADLDPALYEGGAFRVLGRLHDQAPKIPFITGWVSKRKALEYLRRSLALAPENRATWLFLAEAILDHEERNKEEALSLLRRCAESPPRPEYAIEDAHYSDLARATLQTRR